MQQLDKDLPNGSGKRGIFSVLVCVCTLPVGQAQKGDHNHHLLSCGALEDTPCTRSGPAAVPSGCHREGGWCWAA